MKTIPCVPWVQICILGIIDVVYAVVACGVYNVHIQELNTCHKLAMLGFLFIFRADLMVVVTNDTFAHYTICRHNTGLAATLNTSSNILQSQSHYMMIMLFWEENVNRIDMIYKLLFLIIQTNLIIYGTQSKFLFFEICKCHVQCRWACSRRQHDQECMCCARTEAQNMSKFDMSRKYIHDIQHLVMVIKQIHDYLVIYMKKQCSMIQNMLIKQCNNFIVIFVRPIRKIRFPIAVEV